METRAAAHLPPDDRPNLLERDDAVEVPRLAVTGNFTGADALVALAGRVLAQASLTGVYTLNPALKV